MATWAAPECRLTGKGCRRLFRNRGEKIATEWKQIARAVQARKRTWTSCLSWRSEKARWWSGGRSYAVTRRGKTRCLCSVQPEGMLLRGATFVRQPPRLCCRCLTIIWWRPGESEYSVVLKIRKLRKIETPKPQETAKLRSTGTYLERETRGQR